MAAAQTTVAGWAAELVGVVVEDVTSNLLPASAFSQLRSLGLAYAFTGGVIRVPVHAPSASGGFVLEADAKPLGALLASSLTLKRKKAASLVAITRESLQSTPAQIEQSLRVLLGEDLGLMI